MRLEKAEVDHLMIEIQLKSTEDFPAIVNDTAPDSDVGVVEVVVASVVADVEDTEAVNTRDTHSKLKTSREKQFQQTITNRYVFPSI